MSSITLSVDSKGTFLICNNKEVLHGVNFILSSMWSVCGNCDGNHIGGYIKRQMNILLIFKDITYKFDL